MVAAEGGEIERAVPRQDLGGARESRPHQTEPISRSQAGVIRPITYCGAENVKTKEKKHNFFF